MKKFGIFLTFVAGLLFILSASINCGNTSPPRINQAGIFTTIAPQDGTINFNMAIDEIAAAQMQQNQSTVMLNSLGENAMAKATLWRLPTASKLAAENSAVRVVTTGNSISIVASKSDLKSITSVSGLLGREANSSVNLNNNMITTTTMNLEQPYMRAATLSLNSNDDGIMMIGLILASEFG